MNSVAKFCSILLPLIAVGLSTGVAPEARADIVAERAFGADEPRENWESFTNVDFVRDLLFVGDTLWAATSGGLMRWVASTGERIVYTTVDGLGDNDLSFVVRGDSISGGIWTGGAQGRLTHWNDDYPSAVFNFRDRDDNPMPLKDAAVDHAGFLWVASTIGVSRFDIYRHGGEIKETYKSFGDIPPQTPAQCVAIIEGNAWVGTPEGIARIGIGDINPNDPRRWDSWDDSEGGLVNSDEIKSVTLFQGRVCAATSWGIYAWDEQVAPGDSAWVGIVGSVSLDVRDLYASGDTMWSATNFGPYYMTESLNYAFGNSGLRSRNIVAIAAQSPFGHVVTGALGTGVASRITSSWQPWQFDQIVSNEVNAVVIDFDGQTWLTHPEGIDILDVESPPGSQWAWLTYSAGINRGITQHPDGTIWAVSFGSGAFAIDPDNPENDWTRYDTANSSLRGVDEVDNPINNVVILRDVIVDSSGVVWFGQFNAQEGVSVAFYDNGCWGSLGKDDNLTTRDISALYPAGDFILVASRDFGWIDFEPVRSLCQDGEQRDPPHTHSVDYRSTFDGLPSNDLRDVLVDRSGTFWVGSTNGLAYWDPEIRLFRHQVLPDNAGRLVNAIAADPGNNLWVGTDYGAVRVGVDGTVTHFTPANSGLAGYVVNGVYADVRTSDVYFATNGGLSILHATGGVVNKVAETYAFPNPFVIGEEIQTIRFAAPFGSRVDIFTVSGTMITSVEPLVGWDGRNRSGNLVASGVYLFVVTDANGHAHTGKFAVIHR